MKPNIILITADQWRGDCLGAAGHPIVETPHIDMMTKYGLMCTNAYSAVPTCIAARAALFTGLTQKSHGRVGYRDGVAWNYPCTLPGELAKAGYLTQGVGKMHVYPERKLCGFHNVILHDGYVGFGRKMAKPASEWWNRTDDYLPWFRQRAGTEVDMPDAGLEVNSWVARPWMYAEHLHPTNWVVNQSIDFLRRKDPTMPFFMWSSFVRPHAPLDPPQSYLDQYLRQDIPLPPVGEWADCEDAQRDGLHVSCSRGVLDERAIKRARSAYYALITHIDHQIGRLCQTLKEYDVLNNTIILFTSDHGELLGDHNLFRKTLPYEGSANVPFVLYDPGNILKIPQNTRLDRPVELCDVMPTLLDIAGAEIPKSVEGRSILGLIRHPDSNWREYIHGEHSADEWSTHYITDGKEKYIWFSQTGKEQLFDLSEDPHELHDRSGDSEYAERAKRWRGILIKELAGREEGYSDGTRLIVGQTPKAVLSHTY